MQLSAEGLRLIARFEGFRAKAYRDPVGVWTIGFGHTSAAGEPAVRAGMVVSRVEAEAILARDAEAFARGVRAALRREVSRHQFAALVSFAYNVGLGNFRRSSVLKAVNADDSRAVTRRLMLWCKAGGRVWPGLVRRRAAEAAMYAGEPARLGVRGPVEAMAGKPMLHSSTNLAACLSGLAALLTAAAASYSEFRAALGGGVPPWAFALVIAAAAIWVMRERWLKAREEGV